jgi:CBS-domain-containing membrane protein
MNIAFFITPKNEVVYEKLTSTMRQAIERMEYHRYTAIPIVDEKGRYVATLTEGDLLRKLKSAPNLDFRDLTKIQIADIPMLKINKPVRISCDIEDLILTAVNQNFVPVLDDDDKFIGIIKRSAIINYCYEKMFNKLKKEA